MTQPGTAVLLIPFLLHLNPPQLMEDSFFFLGGSAPKPPVCLSWLCRWPLAIVFPSLFQPFFIDESSLFLDV